MQTSSFPWVVPGLTLCLVVGQLHGQAKPDRYANEPGLIERQDSVYTMAADGTGVHEFTLVARVQSDSALREIGVVNVPFAANSEHVEFAYVRSRHKDGTVTETPGSAALEVLNPVTQAAPFYSDLKQMQLPVRTLGVGDTLEYKVRIVRTKAEALGEFWGQQDFLKNVITLEESVELRFPKDKYVNAWSLGKKPSDSIAGNERVIRWESTYLEPTVGPAADAKKEAEKKRVLTEAEEVDQREGKKPDIAWTTFRNWEAVGAWYRALEADRMVPTTAVKEKVAELTAGKTTQQQKLEAVYDYVATNVRYIGVAFGVGRYQPHEAGTVLENQYGDCKDKHTLLAAMLQALGEKPDAVLIGAGIRFNEEVPSPAAFNHLITRVKVEGKPVFLDTTSEVAPYEFLLAPIRDEQALAIPESGSALLVRTPALPPFKPSQAFDAKGEIDAEGTSNSSMVLTIHGDDEVAVRQVLRQVGADKWDLLMQGMVQAWGYQGTVSHASIGSASDLSQPLKMTFDYKRLKNGNWDHLQIVPQFPPVLMPRPSLTEPVTASIQLGVPRTETSVAELKLPAGWTVELPEAVHRKSVYASLDVTYRLASGTIHAERKLEVFKEKVLVADVKTYSAWAEAVDLGSESFMQLQRPVGKTILISPTITSDSRTSPATASGAMGGVFVTQPPAGDPHAAIAGSSSPTPATATSGTGDKTEPTSEEKAKQMMEEARQILSDTARPPKDALPLLDQVKAINPNESNLYGLYGYLGFRSGDLHAAEDAYRKEIANHPSNTSVYPLLVQAQVVLKHRSEAVVTLRQWASTEPANAIPTLQLTGFLMDRGDYPEAVKAAESGLENAPRDAPPNESVRVALGRAQLKAGMKDKGHQTLLAVLKSTDNPGLMNDAAYELADAGLELPLAEQTTRTALDRMEEESRTWTLDENAFLLSSKTQMLQATWDTMGWILFREGKVDEGDRYIRASWTGRQSAEVGKHLAEIALARGKRTEALDDFELARATFPTIDMLGGHAEPGLAEKQMLTQMDELKKSGVKSTIGDAREELQKLRKIDMGSALGLSGFANYTLLVQDNAIQRIKATGDKEIPGGEDRIKKVRLPGFTPTGSKAQLVLNVTLNCHQEVCELILIR